MKFLIFIVTNSRRGNPRLAGFSFSDTYQKYLYQGRALTSDEFNEGVAIFLEKPINAKGYAISVKVIDPVADEAMKAAAAAAAEQAQKAYEKACAVADGTEPEVAEAPAIETEPETEAEEAPAEVAEAEDAAPEPESEEAAPAIDIFAAAEAKVRKGKQS